jgi:Porin subfamily
MNVKRRSSVLAALGSMTAAVALLAGAPDASAQPQAAGGGSFPGSFLVPGTNTSIKIGGFVKIVGIYDMSARGGDTIAIDAIPLRGSAASPLHGATRFHARQTNLSFDTRTPTAYGDLTTFILVDMFGQNTSESQNQSTTQNTRLVYGYGTLGPFLAGQWLSLWADSDAIPEGVDPTGYIGVMDGLSNRQPQFRYTFAAPGGFSAAVSIENPEAEGIVNGTTTQFTTSNIGGIDRYPDLLARVRLDQAWGHLQVGALYRDMKVITQAAGVAIRAQKSSYGLSVSGHLNTFGKDSLKSTFMWGKALGHYETDEGRTSGADGLQANLATGRVSAPTTYSINVGYTHWWTQALRSTLDAGYSHNSIDHLTLSAVATQNAVDKRHIGGRVNIIWSPVPQVDLGIEYDWARRDVWNSSGATQSLGYMNRLEVESVFKF